MKVDNVEHAEEIERLHSVLSNLQQSASLPDQLLRQLQSDPADIRAASHLAHTVMKHTSLSSPSDNNGHYLQGHLEAGFSPMVSDCLASSNA